MVARTVAFVNVCVGFVHCARLDYQRGTAYIATACYFMLAAEAFV